MHRIPYCRKIQHFMKNTINFTHNFIEENKYWEFPHGPVLRLCSHCPGCGFDPWLGN